MYIIKNLSLLALALTVTLISSCEAPNGSYPAQTDPDTSQFDNGYLDFKIDVKPELDYNNIIVFTDNVEYPLNFDRIKITIKNQNNGRGFYFFNIPIIEYKDKGEWLRLNYDPEAYKTPEHWAFCGIEGDNERQFSTVISIWNNRLADEWKEGEYRVLVFVGKKEIVTNFKLSN